MRFEWTATDYTPGNAVGMLLFWDLSTASSDGQE
jgi:hypothetical protein